MFGGFSNLWGKAASCRQTARWGMPALRKLIIICCSTFVIAALTACGSGSNKGMPPAGDTASILLFNGTGVSTNDVAAIQTILGNNHLSYSTVNSLALNRMNQSQFMKYRLLIMPGGNFVEMGKSLDTGTAAKIRLAVQHGLNYLGICAGAFLAGNSAYYNGFNLTSGVTFGFYSAENQGIQKAALTITSSGTGALDQYWEGGPQFSGWGVVVARYPDNTPAVTQGKCGNGYVILTGIHAEAPEDWRRGMTFNTPASEDHAYAAMLVRAALEGDSLPHY